VHPYGALLLLIYPNEASASAQLIFQTLSENENGFASPFEVLLQNVCRTHYILAN
jgi:hypothetical protein